MDSFSLLDQTRAELGRRLLAWGYSPAHSSRLWRYVYRDGVTDFDAMGELSPRLRERLQQDARLELPRVAHQTLADDGRTVKYLLELADGERVETVLMRCDGRVTACVSSQAGCPLGCVFCATGQMGFGRNLTAGEIVGQVVMVSRELRLTTLAASSTLTTLPASLRVRNIVLMGMGEPLLNYDAVLKATEILGDGGGLAIAGKRLTLSTVGVVPGIVRLADERRRCSLAVSLHAATQEERAALVLAANTWPLAELMDACRYYTEKLGRRIFFEWTLIPGVNDSADQARALARLLRGFPAQINLIPLNPTDGYVAAPGDADSLDHFQTLLRDFHLPVTIRRRRGIAIAAGCGQLAGVVTH